VHTFLVIYYSRTFGFNTKTINNTLLHLVLIQKLLITHFTINFNVVMSVTIKLLVFVPLRVVFAKIPENFMDSHFTICTLFSQYLLFTTVVITS
jgi:hypothetical protein